MQHLNPLPCKINSPVIRPPRMTTFDIRGRKFVFDGNSLDLYEIKNEDAGKNIVPTTIGPVFPFFPSKGAKCIVFELTHRCNLKCKYCFVELFYQDEDAGNLSLETAKKAIKTLVNREEVTKEKRFQIGFFGGEPLVNWAGLRDITHWCEGYFEGIHLGKSVTTNACLVDKEKAKFLKRHGFSFIVSIDGPKELHDKNRITHSGQGSFDDTIKGLMTLVSEGNTNSTLRSTYLPNETRVLERTVFLNDLCDKGLGNWVSVEPACMTESRCVSHIPGEMVFTEENVPLLRDELLTVADWMIQRVREGKTPRFHVIYKMIERMFYHLHAPSECGGGTGYLSVNPSGELFACHREINSKIGDLDKGFDQSLRNQWIDNRSCIRPLCCACPIQWVCGGGCRETSIGGTGDIHTPDSVSCLFKKIFFDCAVWVMANLSPDEISKFVKNPRAIKPVQNSPKKPPQQNFKVVK